MKVYNRLKITLPLGFLLGILCIIGVSLRVGIAGNEIFLIAMLYNRIIMGIMVALAYPIVMLQDTTYNSIIRGFFIGLLVTASIFLSSEFKDILSFFAGLGYGIILDFVATKYATE